MIDTIDYLKELLDERISFKERGAHNNVANITLMTAYRLIEAEKLEPLYDDQKQARKAINKALTSSELAVTIRQQYREETKYEDTPQIAVKWANITSEVEKVYGIRFDRRKLKLYRNMPLKCECGERCILNEVKDRRNKDKTILKWCCPFCGASVGVHKGTDIPLGKPVSGNIGKKRIQVHKEINRIVDSGMAMDRVYRLLGKKMGLKAEQTHAGMFDEKQCEEALTILKEIKGNFCL